MNAKEIAKHWYLKGAKDAEETKSVTDIEQTIKDFETHFELQYEPLVKNGSIHNVSNRYYYHSECGPGIFIREYNHPTFGDMMVVIADGNGKEYFAPKNEFEEMLF